jgi:hypothetical protein
MYPADIEKSTFIKWLFFAAAIQVGLGTLTAVADVSLHLTATSVQREIVAPLGTPSTLYSLELMSNCTSGKYAYKCENESDYSAGFYNCATTRQGVIGLHHRDSGSRRDWRNDPI